ncbi:MAG: 3D domain-containing protein, partial [Phycisphaerae bacterium]|nr:3D domain-containing protein [Phycisphaerae bacterium]
RRTVATDKRKGMLYPPACLAFLAMKESPDVKSYAGFACDQDTGGAIRAAGRCDLYLGVGAEGGAMAGRMMQEGKLYYLFLKPGQPAPAMQPTTPPVPTVPPSKTN